MDVKLKVVNGSHTGTEIPIKGPKFFVGRSEECHLRPKSDLISRHHCVLMIDEGCVVIRDLGSRNGTIVNDERVVGELELKTGDRLDIGQLKFEVIVTIGEKPKKRPKVSNIKEAVARTAETISQIDNDIDLSDLFVDDEQTKPDRSTSETFVGEVLATDEVPLGDTRPGTGPETEPPPKKPPHRPPRKVPSTASVDSGSAAADALKKFMNRR